MSGTGVQSAMRRRTRPPPDPRKQMNSSGNTPRQTQEQPMSQQQGQGQNPKMVNPTQILYMHQTKILAMEKQLANLGVEVTNESTITNNNSIIELTTKVKEDIETNLDKRLSVINNNLNYVLNGVNEQRQKTKIMESMIKDLTNKNSLLEAALALKLDNDVFSDYKCLNDSIIDELRLKSVNPTSINSDEIMTNSDEILTNSEKITSKEIDIENNETIEKLDGTIDEELLEQHVEASTTEASTTEASTTEASTTEASTAEASTTEVSTTTIRDIKDLDNETLASIENIKIDITEIVEPTASELENQSTTRNKKRR